MERRNDIPNLLAMYIRNTTEIYNITSWLQNSLIKKINLRLVLGTERKKILKDITNTISVKL